MTAIITSDLHLTDNPRDEYRWGLFDWLEQQQADDLLLLGDICDAKDKHSARLVNRLHHALQKLRLKYNVYWLMGNHDHFDPDQPFFQFMGDFEGITYIRLPVVHDLSIGQATFIPANVSQSFNLHQFPYTFCHHTFSGAQAENGQQLEGLSPEIFKSYTGMIYSGDIHVPQQLRPNLIYVGAPYHIRFGDDFEPRILMLGDKPGQVEELHFPCLRKHTLRIGKVRELTSLNIPAGDQVKVICHLARADYPRWKEMRDNIKKYAEGQGWHLFGPELIALPTKDTRSTEQKLNEPLPTVTAIDLVTNYAQRHHVSERQLQIGKELLGGS